MKPLKSGEPLSSQWDHVNRIGAGHQFTHFETINTRDAMSRRAAGGRDLRTPLGGGGLNFVGEYDPTKNYSLNMLCIVSMGANAGSYIWISATPSTGTGGANPTTSPWLGGGNWVQLPGGNGSWL